MSADFEIRAYHPNKGNNPLILTRKKEKPYTLTSHGNQPVYEKLELREYNLYGGSDKTAEPFNQAARKKEVVKPAVNAYERRVNCFLGDERGSASKIIYRTQPGTNNKTTIAFDYISDEMAKEKYANRPRYETNGFKAVEITRDLKNGDVLEFTARQTNNGKNVILDKFALKSGQAIENIPQFLNSLKAELDPLAKNWIRKALTHIV